MNRLILSHGDFESPESLAFILNWIADFIEADQPTSYTGDKLRHALARVNATSGDQMAAVDAIRGNRRKPKARPIKL